MEAEVLTPQAGDLVSAGAVDVELPAAVEPEPLPEEPARDVLGELNPNTLDAAFNALADTIVTLAALEIALANAEHAAAVAKAKAWPIVTLSCKNDMARDYAMTAAFEETDAALQAQRNAVREAKTERELAKLEVDRLRILWSIRTGLNL